MTTEEVQFILGIVLFLAACTIYGFGLDKVLKHLF